MNKPGEHLSEEPQEQRGTPGSRDTGSDQPSGGPTDRPSGTYRGDETVPAHGEPGSADATGSAKSTTTPSDTTPAVPPYEGRQTTAKPPGEQTADQGARTGGAVKPTPDPGTKAPAPERTPGGATASPAQEQPAAQGSETERADDRVGPSHVPGTGRAEDTR
ncbi:hypothetical protein [Mycolicibacterium thermoresistibile]